MSWYQSHCKALRKKQKQTTHTRSHQTSSHMLNFSQVGKAVCQPMKTLGTEEGDGSIGSWGGGGGGSICFDIFKNNQSNDSMEKNCCLNRDKHPPTTHIRSPQYPANDGGQKALAWQQLTTTCHRRWSSPSWLSVWWAAWTPAAPRS